MHVSVLFGCVRGWARGVGDTGWGDGNTTVREERIGETWGDGRDCEDQGGERESLAGEVLVEWVR